MADRGLLVQNATFVHFFSRTFPAIALPAIRDQCYNDRCGSTCMFIANHGFASCILSLSLCRGWTTKFATLLFINVTLRARFYWPSYIDLVALIISNAEN
jgi:hypothetical protein